MRTSRAALASLATALVCTATLSACGDEQTSDEAAGPPARLPVGAGTWDADAPSWVVDETLHVGRETVPLPGVVDAYVVTVHGVYWLRGDVLHLTDTAGRGTRIGEVDGSSLLVSPDRSRIAMVDDTSGPTDSYGTHVQQLVVYDADSGRQVYRTPDEEPDRGDDLADLYEEISPLLTNLTDDRVVFGEEVIDLATGEASDLPTDDEGLALPDGEQTGRVRYGDGFRVGVRITRGRAEVVASEAYGTGRLSPDRRLLLDVSQSPAVPVVYDARTGERQRLRLDGDLRMDSFDLAAFLDDGTFYGLAGSRRTLDGGPSAYPGDEGTQSAQVVLCRQRTLRCTPLSPAVDLSEVTDGRPVPLLVEGRATGL